MIIPSAAAPARAAVGGSPRDESGQALIALLLVNPLTLSGDRDSQAACEADEVLAELRGEALGEEHIDPLRAQPLGDHRVGGYFDVVGRHDARVVAPAGRVVDGGLTFGCGRIS